MCIYNHVAIEWIAIIIRLQVQRISSVCAANEAKAVCYELKSRDDVIFD